MKKFLSLSLALLMILSLAACGGGSGTSGDTSAPKDSGSSQPASSGSTDPTPASGGKLVVYSALNEDNTIAIADQFKADTGIEIEYISLGGGDAVARVQAEMGNPKADFLVGGSVDLYGSLSEAGAFLEYDSPNNDGLDERFNDPNHFWQGWYMGVLSIIVNQDRFDKELAPKGLAMPETWDDLLDPAYKGEIIMAHPTTSGTAYTVLATLVQLKGDDGVWEYLGQLNNNMSQYTKSGAAAPNAVAMGEAAIALTFSHDGLQPTAEGYPIELSFPSDGTGYEVGATALIKGGKAEEQENAKLFIDWMCSEKGQGLYAENNSFRVPTNTKAAVADGLVTLDQVEVIDYDAVWAAGAKSDYCNQFEEKIASAPKE